MDFYEQQLADYRQWLKHNQFQDLIGKTAERVCKELQDREKSAKPKRASVKPYLTHIRDNWDSYQIERAILGAFMRERLQHVTVEVRPRHFTKPHHRVIAFYFRTVTNIVDLSDLLKAEGRLRFVGGNRYLVDLLFDWMRFKGSSAALHGKFQDQVFTRQFIQGLLKILAKRHAETNKPTVRATRPASKALQVNNAIH